MKVFAIACLCQRGGEKTETWVSCSYILEKEFKTPEFRTYVVEDNENQSIN